MLPIEQSAGRCGFEPPPISAPLLENCGVRHRNLLSGPHQQEFAVGGEKSAPRRA
jgi:hypothetical protein